MNHLEGGDVQGEANTADTMPIIWVGTYSGVYDIYSEADSQDKSSDQLEPASGQSDITPAPCV